MCLGGDWISFWQLSLREFVGSAEAMAERERKQLHRSRILNHELAQLVVFAIHQPKKMPKPAADTGPPRPMTEEEAGAALRDALLGIKARHDAAGKTILRRDPSC